MIGPPAERRAPLPGGLRASLWAPALFFVAFAVLALSAPADFLNGDATVYADQIRHANFTERTTHLAYYVVAYPVSFLPLALSHALNLLNCAFGAGAIVLVGLTARTITESDRIGLLSALVAALNALVVYNALHAEVYMAQAFFLLAAACLWLLRQTVLAGAAAAVAFLITSSSALAAPFFIVMRPRLRALALMAAVAIAIAAAALLPVLDNYLFGARGLAAAFGQGVDRKLALLKTGQDIFYGFFAFLPFLLAGAIACWRRQALRHFALALLCMWGTLFLFGEKFIDVPVQLPTYMLFAIVAAIGVDAALTGNAKPVLAGSVGALALLGAILLVRPYVPAAYEDHLPDNVTLALYGAAVVLTGIVSGFSASRRVFVAVIAVAVLCNAALIVRKEMANRASLAEFAALAERIRATPKVLLVAKWNDLVRLDWLLHDRPYDPNSFDVDELVGLYPKEATMQVFRDKLRETEAVFLLSPGPALEQILAAAGFEREGARLYRRR